MPTPATAPRTIYNTATSLDGFTEVARNGEFTCARYTVAGPDA